MSTDSPPCLGHHHSKQLVSRLFHPGTQITAGWGSEMEGAGHNDLRAGTRSQALWQECGPGGKKMHTLPPPSARKNFWSRRSFEALTLSAWPFIRWPQWTRPSRALTPARQPRETPSSRCPSVMVWSRCCSQWCILRIRDVENPFPGVFWASNPTRVLQRAGPWVCWHRATAGAMCTLGNFTNVAGPFFYNI